MNKLVFIENGKPVTDSLTVAAAFEKNHPDVLRDIRKLSCSNDFRLSNFAESDYINEQGRKMPRIILSEQGFTMLAMGYTGPKAMEFKEKYISEFHRMREQLQNPIGHLSPQLQYLIQLEQEQQQIKEKLDRTETAVTTLTDGLTATPDHTKVVARVNEYARWTRIGHNEVYNKIYDIMQAQHGIDVRQRVQNERDRINLEHFAKTGKRYAESTLKSKVNGIDVMVRMGVLDKFNTILVGMLAKVKGGRTA